MIAICPAGEDHLAGGLRRGDFEMRVGDPVDAGGVAARRRTSARRSSGSRARPLILMHAEGDTQIPSDHSEELYERAGEPRKLVIAPGGAHRPCSTIPSSRGWRCAGWSASSRPGSRAASGP